MITSISISLKERPIRVSWGICSRPQDRRETCTAKPPLSSEGFHAALMWSFYAHIFSNGTCHMPKTQRVGCPICPWENLATVNGCLSPVNLLGWCACDLKLTSPMGLLAWHYPPSDNGIPHHTPLIGSKENMVLITCSRPWSNTENALAVPYATGSLLTNSSHPCSHQTSVNSREQ